MVQHPEQLRIDLPDEEATRSLAQTLAAQISAPALVFLCGDLGVGKTTFTRYFLRAHGINGAVKSPTYTLLEPYDLAAGPFYHFDLYRINDPWELELAGFTEYFDDPSAICFVEWPERGAQWLPEPTLTLEFSGGQTANDRSVCVRWLG